MTRINDLSTAITEIGQWARVLVKARDEEVEGIIAKIDHNWCFASNCRKFDGSNGFDSGWAFVTDEFRFGWIITEPHIGDKTLSKILSDEGFDVCFDMEFVGLFKEDGTFISANDGRVTTIPVSQFDFFNDGYQKSIIYKGIHGYHHHHGVTQNAPKSEQRGHKIGVELEIEFNRSSLKNEFGDKVKSNWFYCERDGSLQDSTGVEIITVPMNPKDIKNRTTWEQLIGYLANKAKSWDSPRCGLHVHIGREILGSNPEQQSETIGKLLYLYHQFLNGTSMNTKIFGRERAYNEKDGKTKEGEAVKTLGSGVLKLKEVKDTLKKSMIDKSSSDRYFDINLMNTHTIEFRKGRGSIKTSRIIMVIEYCEMMCKYAKSAKWEEISRENFVSYIVDKVSKDSPLYRFFEAGERCDSLF